MSTPAIPTPALLLVCLCVRPIDSEQSFLSSSQSPAAVWCHAQDRSVAAEEEVGSTEISASILTARCVHRGELDRQI